MNKKINWFIFIILIPIIGFLQLFLLKPVFNYGFTPDDWGLLLFYKTLGPDPLSKLPFVWSIKGAYTTSQVYYIGILNNFFGLNYSAYQITNIIFKTLATLSLYPLILIVFKRRSLAFLTVILYGMSDMGSRSLEYVVKGTDYLAIIPMNIFFIIYYYAVTDKVKSFWWIILMSFFWFASLMISPIRIYPILVLIPLIEISLWIQNRSKRSVINSFKRLLVLYSPFILVYLYKPSSIFSFLQNPPTIYKAILGGNWHLALTPFQGVGLSIIFLKHWNRIFGSLNLESRSDYLFFLLGGPLFIFGILTIFLSVVKFKKKLKFFILTLVVNFLLNIIFYYLAIHELSIPETLRLHFDPARMYPILISGFILAVSFASFLEWRNLGKKDNILLALWICAPLTLLYTLLIWLLAPFGVGFEGQQSYYLVVPAIATSIFLASILVIILDKALNQVNRFLRLILVWIFCSILVLLFLINSFNIYNYYTSAGINGRYASDQERMYNKILNYFGGNFNYSGPTLFYFDVSEDGERGTFYTESLFLNLAIRLHIKTEGISEGCIGVFYEGIPSLAKLITIRSGVKGFVYSGQCIINGGGGNTGGVFYKVSNFYAFKAKNGGELTDIKQEVLDQLTPFWQQLNKLETVQE